MTPDDLTPTRGKLLVRRYERPEKFGEHIILPDKYRADMSGTLWEFIKAGPGALDAIGMELSEGEILRTNPWPAVHVGSDLWIMDATAVQEVLLWVGGSDGD